MNTVASKRQREEEEDSNISTYKRKHIKTNIKYLHSTWKKISKRNI